MIDASDPSVRAPFSTDVLPRPCGGRLAAAAVTSAGRPGAG